jgi:hypothetical protein
VANLGDTPPEWQAKASNSFSDVCGDFAAPTSKQKCLLKSAGIFSITGGPINSALMTRSSQDTSFFGVIKNSNPCFGSKRRAAANPSIRTHIDRTEHESKITQNLYSKVWSIQSPLLY